MSTRSARRAVLAALAATLLLTACGKGAVETTATEDDPEAAFLAHARCMREHGIDMPDPQVHADGEGFAVRMDRAIDIDDPAFHRAEKACAKHLPQGRLGGGEIDPEQERRMQEGALKFARCMREHGVDMPDPTFGGEGQVMMKIGPDDGLDPNDPKFQEAQQACGSAFGPRGAKGGAGFSVGSGKTDGGAKGDGPGGTIMFGSPAASTTGGGAK